ncbi:FecR domain-containing protein [Neptuniibacter marinus]|uniref:FecR domain-containing protein n=1 Tax=Neptuniibacter marinus TaxID=1806670 RepID=UPI003B5AAB1D
MSIEQVELPDEIIDEAINWLIQLDINDSSKTKRVAFDHWLQQSPTHVCAWERVKSLHNHYTALPSIALADTLETLERKKSQSRLSRRQAIKMLSISSVVLSGIWLGKEHAPWQRLLADYSTGIGEQGRFILADKSQVILNTDSALSVDFLSKRRKLRLRRGEMYLTAGPDSDYYPKRPLLIQTPFGRISALNTRLTVRIQKSRTKVSVQAGQVELLNRAGIQVSANNGESFWLSNDKIVSADRSSIKSDAWISGAIAGTNIRLGELLDELSRYRVGIIDYSPDLKDRLVSGIFQLKNVDTTLQFIAKVQSVSVEFRTPYWVVVRPA